MKTRGPRGPSWLQAAWIPPARFRQLAGGTQPRRRLRLGLLDVVDVLDGIFRELLLAFHARRRYRCDPHLPRASPGSRWPERSEARGASRDPARPDRPLGAQDLVERSGVAA